jgi:hypothetical protein
MTVEKPATTPKTSLMTQSSQKEKEKEKEVQTHKEQEKKVQKQDSIQHSFKKAEAKPVDSGIIIRIFHKNKDAKKKKKAIEIENEHKEDIPAPTQKKTKVIEKEEGEKKENKEPNIPQAQDNKILAEEEEECFYGGAVERKDSKPDNSIDIEEKPGIPSFN